MTQKFIMYSVLGLLFALVGGILIGDLKVVAGVFLILWANNIGRISLER